MKRMNFCLRISILLMALTQVGCASFGAKLKAFLGGRSAEPTASTQPAKKTLTYSEQPYYMQGPRRKYKRTTKENFEGQAALEESAGSLWVNEGQGAYLFSQNILRMIGDPLTIRLDGEPRAQLQSKAEVIKTLLERLEARRQVMNRGPASEDKKKPDEASKAGEKEEKGDGAATTTASAQKPNNQQQSGFDLNVKSVPTRIIERLVDGNYRIKGSQPIMIGSREYKIIVTGIVRAEDFAEDGMSASKLLDPKFDIVSPRRKEN